MLRILRRPLEFLILIWLIQGCAQFAGINVISQDQWGGEPAKAATHQNIRYITIHHSGVTFDRDKDPRVYLRHLQDWSRREKQWIDIPYHYLMDLDGNIYAGRDPGLPGDTNTSYNVNGHLILCVLGNYEEQTLAPVQYKNLVKFTAKMAQKYQVPLENIRSHHDWVPTETVCPGRNIQKYFDSGRFHLDVIETMNR